MENKIEKIENKKLIALKVPDTADSWKFIDGQMVTSITEAYETYFQKTGIKTFGFDATKVPAEIYAITITEKEIIPEAPPTFSMYGDVYGTYSQQNEN
jgi:hypothetical protein